MGNDYLFFDCFEESLCDPSSVALSVCDRRRSVGADGIIMMEKSAVADAKMRIFNADGSEGRMCGNGIRCAGKFLREEKGLEKEILTIETLSGIKKLKHFSRAGLDYFTVDMGRPILSPAAIPALFEGEAVVGRPLFAGKQYRVTCLSMGNPHCVIFESPDGVDLEKIGPILERHSAFPDRVNVEFAIPIGENEFSMRVWERGSGETHACGTGACAVAVAAVLNGLARAGSDILIRLKGGELTVRYTEDTVLMTGSAEFAFRGEVEI